MSTKIYVFDFFFIYVKESLVRLTLTDEVKKRKKTIVRCMQYTTILKIFILIISSLVTKINT